MQSMTFNSACLAFEYSWEGCASKQGEQQNNITKAIATDIYKQHNIYNDFTILADYFLVLVPFACDA